MRISRQQPLNTVANSVPNHPGNTQFDNKPEQRALCTAVVGKSQYAFAWLEKSLDKFAITKGAESGESIVIVDNISVAMLQRYASRDSTLYQRLLDRGVTFVDSKSIMKFVRTKYGNNPLPELLRNLRQLSFTDQGKGDLKDQLRATILKLLCPDYAFSRDKRLQRVGVVDADSLIPIQPGTIASTGKSRVPVGLRLDLKISTSDGCDFRTPAPVFADSEFLLALIKRLSKLPNRPESIYSFSFKSQLHDSFNEFGSAELAEELTGGVIQIADHLQQLPWLAMPAETKAKFQARGYLAEGDNLIGFGHGVRNLVRGLVSPADLICFQHCLDLRRSDIMTCPPTMGCSESRYQLLDTISAFFFDPQLRLSLQSLVRDFEKLPPATNVHLCCGAGARLTTPDICHNALDRTDCVQLVTNNKGYFLIHLAGITNKRDFNYDVLFHKDDSDKLLPSFSSPLMDWSFQATEPYLRLFDNQESKSVMALSRDHVDILLSNSSAFFQLDASWSLECPQKTPGSQAPALLDQPITGFRYGAMAGLTDELFSFTPLPTEYTWLYSSARGLLFGGKVGLALGLGEQVYLHYIDPVLPNGFLKACIRPVVRNAFLVAALVQGQTLGVLGSVAGYTAVRTVGKKVGNWWSRTKHNAPEHKYNS